LDEYIQKIQYEQNRIKTLMTANFQKVKQFVVAHKNCDKLHKTDPNEQASVESKGEEVGSVQDQSIGVEEIVTPHNQEDEEEVKVFDKNDSDSEDTIFYDAYDALILDEIEREIKRESIVSDRVEIAKEEEYRNSLPAFKSNGKFSLLKILKDAVGKDLTKF